MWIGRLIAEMAVLPGLIYRCNTTPIEISTGFLVETGKLILKGIWKYKGLRKTKIIKRKQRSYHF